MSETLTIRMRYFVKWFTVCGIVGFASYCVHGWEDCGTAMPEHLLVAVSGVLVLQVIPTRFMLS